MSNRGGAPHPFARILSELAKEPPGSQFREADRARGLIPDGVGVNAGDGAISWHCMTCCRELAPGQACPDKDCQGAVRRARRRFGLS